PKSCPWLSPPPCGWQIMGLSFPSPACIRNRACPISALLVLRSRINPTSDGGTRAKRAGRGQVGRRRSKRLPPPLPPPQAGEGEESACCARASSDRDPVYDALPVVRVADGDRQRVCRVVRRGVRFRQEHAHYHAE